MRREIFYPRLAATHSSRPVSGIRKGPTGDPRCHFRAAPERRSPGPPTSTRRPSSPRSTSWQPGRPHMTPISVCCVCRMSTGRAVADEFVHRNSCSLCALGARSTHVEVYEDGRIVRDFVSHRRRRRGAVRCDERPRLNPAASTSGRVFRQPSMSWLKGSPPSAVPPNRSSCRNSATVTYVPRVHIEPAKKRARLAPRWSLDYGLHALLGWIGQQAELACRAKRSPTYGSRPGEVGDLAPGRQR